MKRLAVLVCSLASLGYTQLYQDDFSQQTGFAESASDTVVLSYLEGGEYSMSVLVPDFTQLVTPSGLGSLENVAVEVDTYQPTTEFDMLYGVLCRLQPDGSHYALLISNAGRAYAILKSVLEDDVFVPTVLTSGALPDRGPSGNRRVGAACVGETLTLQVDGEQVDSVSDAGLPNAGQVGLAGISAEAFTGVALALFDNFEVNQLEPSPEGQAEPDAPSSAENAGDAGAATDTMTEPPTLPAATDDTVTGTWVGQAQNDGVPAEELWFNLTQNGTSVTGEVYLRLPGETAYLELGTLAGEFDGTGELNARLNVTPEVLPDVATDTGVLGVRLEFYGRPGGNKAVGNLSLNADDGSPATDEVGSLELTQRSREPQN